MIDKNQVLNVAKLARLELSEDDVAVYTTQLAAILEYVNLLDTAPVNGIEPTCHAEQPYGPLRDDNEQPSLPAEKLLENGPSVKKGHFAVPKIIDHSGGGT